MPSMRVNGLDYGQANGLTIVDITEAEWEALPDSKYSDGILYHIVDAEDIVAVAKSVEYDGSVSGLGNNLQDALDKVNENLGGVRLGKETDPETGEVIVGHYEYDEEAGTDVLVPFSKTISGWEILQLKTAVNSGGGDGATFTHTISEDGIYICHTSGTVQNNTVSLSCKISLTTTNGSKILNESYKNNSGSNQQPAYRVAIISGKVGDTITGTASCYNLGCGIAMLCKLI